MNESEENPEDVQVAEKERKKVNSGDINLTITNQTSLDQQKLWDEIRTSIRDEYEELNIPFNADSITTKEEMEHHVAVLKRLKNAKEEFQRENAKSGPRYGTPITGKEMGIEEPSGDRPIDQLKEATRDIPLDLVQFHSEKEMKDLLNAVANDSSDSRHAEAQKLEAKLLQSSTEKSQTLELEGSLKEALHGKAKFKKKGKLED